MTKKRVVDLKTGEVALVDMTPAEEAAHDALTPSAEEEAARAALAYIGQRAARYRADLASLKGAPGATREDVIGFFVDAMAAQVEAMRVELGATATQEWSAFITAIAAVKADIPKPDA